MSTISIANQISIREAGYDEFWLQDQIYDNPSSLGLGELEAIQRERRQSAGGRLDILLKDPEDDSMYEVEVMLGETDETHIIRTIEYWDNEKRRWPQRQHYAVLVAENMARRASLVTVARRQRGVRPLSPGTRLRQHRERRQQRDGPAHATRTGRLG